MGCEMTVTIENGVVTNVVGNTCPRGKKYAEVEVTAPKRMLSDLRESGALEQDADIVAFIYREDYYNPETEKKNITEFIIAKHRNGPVGTVELFFQKDITCFLNLSKHQEE